MDRPLGRVRRRWLIVFVFALACPFLIYLAYLAILGLGLSGSY